MSPRIRLLALPGIVLTLAAVGIMSCGKDSSAPTAPTGTPAVPRYPLGDGTWRAVATQTPRAGTTCWNSDSWEDTVVVVGGVPDDGDPFAPATFQIVGKNVTQTYADTMEVNGACSIGLFASGSGTLGATSFTFTYDLTLAPIGDCSSSGLTGTCSGRLVIVCTKIAPTPKTAWSSSGPVVSKARAGWFAHLRSRSAD